MTVIPTFDVPGFTIGTPVPHSFLSGGDFRIDTVEAIKARVDADPDRGTPFDTPPGVTPQTKLIVLEDTYKRYDRDYEDWYWKLSVASGGDLATDHQNDFGNVKVVTQSRTADETAETDGVGIRLAGPSARWPGNLYSTKLKASRPVIAEEIGAGSNVSYWIRRSNEKIQLQGEFQDVEFFLEGESEREIPAADQSWQGGNYYANVYMEAAGDSTLTLVRKEGISSIELDSVKYRTFDTLAIGFSGESTDWFGLAGTDPLSNGMADVSKT